MSTFQTLIPAAATLVGGIVAAVVSGYITIWVYNNRKEAEAEQLRRAIAAEVRAMDTDMLVQVAENLQRIKPRPARELFLEEAVKEQFKRADDEEVFEAIPEETMNKLTDWGAQKMAEGDVNVLQKLTEINLSTDVYDANLDKIGRLDIPDIRKLIRYYERISEVQATANEIIDLIESREQTGSVSMHSGRLKRQANGLDTSKQEVLELLEGDKQGEEDD